MGDVDSLERRARTRELVQCPCCLGMFYKTFWARFHRRHCWYKPVLELIERLEREDTLVIDKAA